MRILIAEDERISRELLRRALENIRHEVIAVTDGLEAWNHIVDESADIRLVIADWMMPGLDGIELTRRIRSAGFRHYVYVIMLTSRGQRQDVIDGLSAGADDYVLKRRLHHLVSPPAQRLAAVIVILMALTVPFLEVVPFAAALPMAAIALIGIALTVRDGLVMLFALITAGVAVVSGLMWLL